MALARIEQKVMIIKKEAVRGTSEAAPAGGRAIPFLPASEVSPQVNLIANGKIFGDAEERDAVGGIRQFTGTAELEPSADKLGEFLLSLLGGVVTDQPDVGNAPTVFRHRFTSDDDAQHPMYTLFMDRQTHQKKYGGTVIPQMTFTFPTDGKVSASIDLMAKVEEAGAVLTPDFSSDLADLIFSDVSVDLVGVKSTQIAQASVQINHNAIPKHVLCDTRDAVDIVAGPLQVSGSFTLYFEDDVERAKFVGDTFSDLLINARGQVLEDIQVASFLLDMPRIKYDAGTIGEIDGILAQDFSYVANRDPSNGFALQASLINLETAY